MVKAASKLKAGVKSRTSTVAYDVAEQLRTPEEMAAYLDAWLEEAPDDAAGIARALGDIARDVASIAFSPARAKDMDFTAPHLEVELGYLIPGGSSISTMADVDRPGIRVAIQEKGLADIFLSRTLKNAVVVRASSIAATCCRLTAVAQEWRLHLTSRHESPYHATHPRGR
jgi:ABC-type amino acid transport substrate-binding protein